MPKEETLCPLCGEPIVKHITKEGARFHVYSYNTNGVHCSEHACETNHGYGKCVPKENDPLYGMSFEERMKRIIHDHFKETFDNAMLSAGDKAHKTLVKQMKTNPDAIEALYE